MFQMFFNIEKQKATSKQITHLKLADNSVTEDEQVIRQMTIYVYVYSYNSQYMMKTK